MICARGLAATLVVPLVTLLGVGCVPSEKTNAPATSARAVPTASTGATGSSSSASTLPSAGVGGRTRLDGFREVTITVVGADGTTRQHCLLLADTEPLRERGLMFVEDGTLGGYDGMLFLFQEDSAGGFWMKNTRLALSIAYVAADGRTVSTADMAPCPDTNPNCPAYPAKEKYRYAVEVPKGDLGKVGLSTTSKLTVGEQSCAGVPRSS